MDEILFSESFKFNYFTCSTMCLLQYQQLSYFSSIDYRNKKSFISVDHVLDILRCVFHLIRLLSAFQTNTNSLSTSKRNLYSLYK